MHLPQEPSAGGAGGRSGYSVVTERAVVRRPARRLLWPGIVVLPVALAALVGWSAAPQLEAALAADVSRALEAEGVSGVRVAVEGRQVAARVPTGRDPVRVVEVARRVPGVMSVTPRRVYASPAEARACRGIVGKVDRATGRQQLPFAESSTTLTAAGHERARAAAALLVACPAVRVVVGGHTDSSAADPGALSLARARAVVTVLERAGVAPGRMEVRGYGDQFRLAADGTAAARARNQRGSIVVEGP
jgi:hypothetical protein